MNDNGIRELCVLWRLDDGLRCLVLHSPSGWEMRVMRSEEIVISAVFHDGDELLRRARRLRAEFQTAA
jgi:hypothetical protein